MADYNPLISTDSVDVFEKDGHSLQIARPAVGGVDLSYTRIATFLDQASPAPTAELAVFGVTTQAEDVPTTGSATYTTAMSVGGYKGGFYNLSGSSATFTANFEGATVATDLTLEGTPVEGGALTAFTSLHGTGAISGAGFSGGFGEGTTGGFAGAFFGPEAGEMAYSFQAETGDEFVFGQVWGKK
ncbi:transferrin-binding protein-like solute binding protein [Croceicoccus estronivorus]|uniref:transferrin-binding protein-like solute binding protein n=1 Tax=Croceicoccus estronivorus TaxID=1172626 RepID=UPI0038B24F54